jgi:hypothetical protein
VPLLMLPQPSTESADGTRSVPATLMTDELRSLFHDLTACGGGTCGIVASHRRNIHVQSNQNRGMVIEEDGI